ncbi:MAG TPA: metalloregulator ArsR/SmtB family transcription factor [Arthrobacter sp.]
MKSRQLVAALHNTLASTNVYLVLDALEIAAEPNRRRLLHLLASREQAVGELAAHFTVSRSAVSQHLLLLEQAGLVSARKEGRNRYYSLDPQGMGRLRELVEQFWTNELDLLASDAAAVAAQRHGPPQHDTTKDSSLQDKGPLR